MKASCDTALMIHWERHWFLSRWKRDKTEVNECLKHTEVAFNVCLRKDFGLICLVKCLKGGIRQFKTAKHWVQQVYYKMIRRAKMQGCRGHNCQYGDCWQEQPRLFHSYHSCPALHWNLWPDCSKRRLWVGQVKILMFIHP